MILPGHLAASLLTHRYLRANLRVALVAGVAPDVIDKALYYGLGVTPASRVPMHTLLGLVMSTLLVAAVGWLVLRSWLWGYSWLVAYAAHLLCDSPLVGDDLPFLWPWLPYPDLLSAPYPAAYLFDPSTWPVQKLATEVLLVAVVAVLELRHACRQARPLREGGLRAGSEGPA